ncbi:MAG: HdeD family acid-resistance protein [Thermomicrobiales bacterium]
MTTPMLGMVSRNWWVFVLRGVLAILFGIVAWVWPGLTVTAFVFLFGAYAFVNGIFAIINGIASFGENRRWWAELLVGIAGIVLGFLTFVWPRVTALALLYLIAAWAIVSGVFEIIAAIELRKAITNEWLLGLGGVLSVLFGLILIVFPGSGAISLVWVIGIYAIIFGATLIALGLRLRNVPVSDTSRLP